jgi:hypothetical protein
MMLGRELMSWQSPFTRLSLVRREMDDFFIQAFGDWERTGIPWASMGYAPWGVLRFRERTKA